MTVIPDDVSKPATPNSRSGGSGESEAILLRHQANLVAKGVVVTDMATARREYSELVNAYLGTSVPLNDKTSSAVTTPWWCGGSFVYVPPGVDVELPIQVHAATGGAPRGPFERTLIVADRGAKVHYIEGCSAPVYTSDSLQTGVVEVVVKAGARVSFTTIQTVAHCV
ncbi:MAG: SufD family Fe-S cluster assembly protein [Acidimicrobiales bacterium]